MDDLRRIDLNLLLALHALLQERHVTRAATRLHRSQPAVSHALAQLRALFDDPLLVRRGRQMQLTTRAEALRQPLESALGQLGALLRGDAFDPATAVRTFRVALSDYGAHLLLPSVVDHLRRLAPGIALAISQASRDAMLAQLADGEIDLACGVFPDAPEPIRCQTLLEERFTCIADRATLPRRGALPLEAWLARPHVLVAMRADAPNEVDLALAARGLRRQVALSLPHWSAAPRVIAGTDLVLTIASRALDGLADDPRLRTFAPPLPLPRFAFQQAWHARRDTDPAHAWLRQCVLAGVDPEARARR